MVIGDEWDEKNWMVGSLDFSSGFFLFELLPEFHLDFFKFVDVFIIFLITNRLFLIFAFSVVFLRIDIYLICLLIFVIRVVVWRIFFAVEEDGSNRTFLIPVFIHVDLKESNFILLLVFIIWIFFFPICELNTRYFLTVNHFYQPNYRQNYAQADGSNDGICVYHACGLSYGLFL